MNKSDFAKVLTEMPLDAGPHKAEDGKACVMEKVAILWAMHAGLDVAEVFSDLPACTNSIIAKAAQSVNDRLSDTERQKLNAFIPRLLRARRTPSDHRINVRLAVWASRRLHDADGGQEAGSREAAEAAIEAAQQWLDDPTEENRIAVGWASASAQDAYYASYIDGGGREASYAAYMAAYAASYGPIADGGTMAHAAWSAVHRDLRFEDYSINYLSDLLDAWEEAVTKEGEDLYVPQAWEDEALAFVDEWMGAAP
jgi:hypothetical protein